MEERERRCLRPPLSVMILSTVRPSKWIELERRNLLLLVPRYSDMEELLALSKVGLREGEGGR